jgi:hypothetical protein
MNKKLFLILGLIMMVSLSGVAQTQTEQNPEVVILHIKTENPAQASGPIRRSPAMPPSVPSVSLEDHTLYFNSPCDDCTLQLINEDGDVEVDMVIPEDTTTITLPFYLEGEYLIQIIRGRYCFYGFIEL